MKRMWKNVLGVTIVAAVSVGAAIGTSTYLIEKNESKQAISDLAQVFNQPIHYAGINAAAAENIKPVICPLTTGFRITGTGDTRCRTIR